MKILDFLLGHQDLVNKFNEGVGQVKASMDGKQKDLDKSGEGYFFKSWQQEFWGAKTLSECELQEFQFKCEAVRMFLELITDENGSVSVLIFLEQEISRKISWQTISTY